MIKALEEGSFQGLVDDPRHLSRAPKGRSGTTGRRRSWSCATRPRTRPRQRLRWRTFWRRRCCGCSGMARAETGCTAERSAGDLQHRAPDPDAHLGADGRRALRADGARHHLHLLDREDHQLGDGRVLHDRQLHPVRGRAFPARTALVVAGGDHLGGRHVSARTDPGAGADQADVRPPDAAPRRLRHRRDHRAAAAAAQPRRRAWWSQPVSAGVRSSGRVDRAAAAGGRARGSLGLRRARARPLLARHQEDVGRPCAQGRRAEPRCGADVRRRRLSARCGRIRDRRRARRPRRRAACAAVHGVSRPTAR